MLRRRSLVVPVAFLCTLTGALACPKSPPPAESEAPPPDSAAAEPPPAPILLALASAAALRQAGGGLLVRCNATLTNRTGDTLQIRTNFSSPFDGLSLVLTDETGTEIARQAYIHHQSPYSQGTDRPLSPGDTPSTLVFPIDGLPGRLDRVQACLEGGLPGTPFETGLRSESVPLRVSSDTERDP